MLDSRAFRTNTPKSIQLMQKYILQPLTPVLNRFVNSTFRTSQAAGVDMVELAINEAYSNGDRGYFTMLKKDEPDSIVLDEEIQQKIWVQAAKWAKITANNSPVKRNLDLDR